MLSRARITHGRLVNQVGLFTFSPSSATLENKLTDVLADRDGFTDEELRAASEEEQPEIPGALHLQDLPSGTEEAETPACALAAQACTSHVPRPDRRFDYQHPHCRG